MYIYVFCIYLRTNSDLCHLQHKLIGFYNRDEKCLQRGTDCVFKYSGLRFVSKGLKHQGFGVISHTDAPEVRISLSSGRQQLNKRRHDRSWFR